jgi:phosphoglycerate dehydrogenase-like enzyme
MTLILSGRKGYERHQEILDQAAGDEADWLLMDDDKRIIEHRSGQEMNFGAVRPDIAWCGLDIFRSPAGRRFFKLVQTCPSLQWVQTAYAGHDAQMWSDLLERGVTLTRGRIAGIPIAEFVIGAVLRRLQEAPKWEQARSERSWSGHVFSEIDQSRWLIVGMGDIGNAIGQRVRPWGAHVTGVRRNSDGSESADRMIVPDQLTDAIADADVIVLAAPANADSDQLIGASQLEKMKPTSLLVNVGRGNAIDEAALLRSLEGGRPAAAILDVFATEPLPADSVWWTHPKVDMTAHVSSMGEGRYRRAAELFALNLTRGRMGQPLLHRITLDDLN